MGAPSGPRTLCLLGSTGVLGSAALAEALAHPDLLKVTALAAGRSTEILGEQAEEVFRTSGVLPTLAIGSERQAQSLRDRLRPLGDPEVLSGPEGLARLASAPGTDTVLCAVTGLAAFPAAHAAARAGRHLILATKEALALGGAALKDLARDNGGRLTPLDSELWAAARLLSFQGLAEAPPGYRLLLTASGGPLWHRPKEAFEHVTPEEILRHPIWPLGPKIAVDSATQLNKAHEVVAAAQLFGFAPEAITVVIHPEARIHAVLGLPGGTELALSAPPDMRIPLVNLLGLPAAPTSASWALAGAISLQPVDVKRFPGVALGHEALASGPGGRAALVGACEAAVEAFLAGRIPFQRIASAVAEAVEKAPACPETPEALLATALEERSALLANLTGG
ncbi:MAG: 1-deoxy-D-xylulose-5-phosphate reductoisomerase [Polyangia bacterium]|jgi:1-deoxy-D-xylulose-5-phosphate reductoisomerase|nr:1-deoxy-D-xylulose-5-phosphate reductoisomerase [Polyangia bacterium]